MVGTCGATVELAVACLEHLKQHTDSLEELILVDNGSPGPAGRRIKAAVERAGGRLAKLERNHGPGFARNVGYSLTTKAEIAFVDDDVLVTAGWDAPLREILRSHGMAGQVTSSMARGVDRHPYRDHVRALQWWDSLRAGNRRDPSKVIAEFTGGRTHEEFLRDYIECNGALKSQRLEVPPDGVGGGCFLATREALNACGGPAVPPFDKIWNEDIDLSWRLARCGFEVYRSAWSFVHHFRHGSTLQLYSEAERKALFREANREFSRKWQSELVALRRRYEEAFGATWLEREANWFLRILEETSPQSAAIIGGEP